MTRAGGTVNMRSRIIGKFFMRGSIRRLASMARMRGSLNAGASRAFTQLPNVKHIIVSRV